MHGEATKENKFHNRMVRTQTAFWLQGLDLSLYEIKADKGTSTNSAFTCGVRVKSVSFYHLHY